MRRWIALVGLSLACSATFHGQRRLRPRYPLPARAKVVVDGPYNDMKRDDPFHDVCNRFRTTPQQIRRYFNTSFEIDGPERHDGIDELACGIDGRILLDGHTYTWRLLESDPAGFLETNFPDGQSRMLAHRLGDLSDDPHLHRPSRYIDLHWWKQ